MTKTDLLQPRTTLQWDVKFRLENNAFDDRHQMPITNIIQSIAFWNRHKDGFPYDCTFNKMLASLSNDNFRSYLLDMILCDCKVFTENSTLKCVDLLMHLHNQLGIKCGRGGHHVWVSNSNNERIMMIWIEVTK